MNLKYYHEHPVKVHYMTLSRNIHYIYTLHTNTVQIDICTSMYTDICNLYMYSTYDIQQNEGLLYANISLVAFVSLFPFFLT